ncbi:MAG: hypothetical protein RSD40_07115, partial [Bacilli bacterium]
MKLKILSLYLITSATILLSTQTQTQAQIAVPNNTHINPDLVERGKGLAKGLAKKYGNKIAVDGAKKV